ncbi:MAG TPA: ferrochelatase [Pyrinomonadaceae bacterium]|nr:ferrochelatase [Pyrinomonadaceae bacterium]
MTTKAQPTIPYDALLLVSFGGPESMDDVLPFLENVLRGRNVPRERMLQVAHHYGMFGGVSPINEQNRNLIAALKKELEINGPSLPIYWGNRNWHPLLTDTVPQMAKDGVKRALAFVTSAYSSFSSCRQYLQNIAEARSAAGDSAPEIDKLRAFYNHPLFIEANAKQTRTALHDLGETSSEVHLVFTAHSIPTSMALNCAYAFQLNEAGRLVAEAVGINHWKLVYQSRSGPPTQPWLGPDVCDYLKELRERGVSDVVIAPIGFVSDHMEVIYDLDVEAKKLAQEIGLNLRRAATAGTHPLFVKMIRELIMERMNGTAARHLGNQGASHDVCDPLCCLPKS